MTRRIEIGPRGGARVWQTCTRCGREYWYWQSDERQRRKRSKHCSYACRTGKPKGDRAAQRMAFRLDLVRVAREVGRPNGVSPSRDEYTEHGVFSFPQAQGLVCGWRVLPGGGRRPAGTWPKAMKGYGLTSPERLIRRPDPAEVAKDVLHVAALIGQPEMMPPVRKYRKMGAYSTGTVRRSVGAARWNDAAVFLGLTPRRQHASRVDWVRERRSA